LSLIRHICRSLFTPNSSLSRTLLIPFLYAWLTACNQPTANEDQLPDTLKIGLLPDVSEQVLRERHAPLLDYLSQQLSLNYTFIIPDNYADLLTQFSTGKIDLAYFGGLTYVKARQTAGAIPIVMRDIDTRFTSYFITNKNHADDDLKDFKNTTLSFGSKLSTSGHLMPRYFLNKKIGPPENFFKHIIYSGAHDKTVNLIRDSKADIGAVNANILNTMFKNGSAKRSDIRILSETPPYPDYVWAVAPHISKAGRIKLRDTFLSLLPTSEANIKILNAAGTHGFLPASNSDFEPLLKIASESCLLEARTNQ